MLDKLLVVNGPWQAISGLAVLSSLSEEQGRKNEGPSARKGDTRKEMSRTAALIVDLVLGTMFHDITAKILGSMGIERIESIDKKLLPESFGRELKKAMARLGLRNGRLQELLLFGLHRPISRHVARLFPRASIIVYEDGLRSYLPYQNPETPWTKQILDRARSMLSSSFARSMPGEDLFRRVKTRYLLLPEIPLTRSNEYGEVPTQYVPFETVRSVFDGIETKAECRLERSSGVLIVGQYFSELGQMDAAREKKLYLGAVDGIKETGKIPVWRGHIRQNDDRIYDHLKEHHEDIINMSDFVGKDPYPLEVQMRDLPDRFHSVVSFSSSSLFYLKKLYGLPCYTLLQDDVIEGMTDPHRTACRLVLEHVPRFGT